MVTLAEEWGGSEEISFAAHITLPARGRRFYALTATAGGLLVGLPMLAQHVFLGIHEVVIWNAGSNTFTVATQDGPFSQIFLAAGDACVAHSFWGTRFDDTTRRWKIEARTGL